VFLWYVPANVAGRWRWEQTISGKPRPYDAKIDQQFQELDAAVLVDGGSAAVRNPLLRGSQVSFAVTRELFGQRIDHEFTGRVEGDAIVGRVRITGGGEDTTQDWKATRVERGVMRIDK
jgi:hypothetical protein